MFRLGDSTNVHSSVERPLAERIAVVGYAAMGYWFYRWDWGENIAIDGLMDAGVTLGNSAYTDFCLAEAERWAYDDRPDGRPNPMGPAAALLHAVQEGSVRDEEAALRCLRRLADDILGTGTAAGVLVHEAGAASIFVDSLYGLPSFLARLGRFTESAKLLKVAVALTLGHCRRLQSEDNGLFAHFADLDAADGARICWGRGNGWAVLGLSDLLVAVPPDVPGADELSQRFRALLDGLRMTQASGGWWRNIVDDPASYPEASVTAMTVAAVTQAVDAGKVDSGYLPMADTAWATLEHRVDANGHVVGVSYRPGLNIDPARYEHTPAVGAYPWGQGPYLRAACPRLRRERARAREENDCSP